MDDRIRFHRRVLIEALEGGCDDFDDEKLLAVVALESVFREHHEEGRPPELSLIGVGYAKKLTIPLRAVAKRIAFQLH